MPHSNIIAGESESEIWRTISEQLHAKTNELDYTAQFCTQKHTVTMDIDIHPDTSDENGGPMTSFSAELPEDTSFRFRIQKQNLKHGLGKLFGMQDVIIGHPEFDKKFLIQSTDEAKVKELLSKTEVSDVLLKHAVIEFEIREHKVGAYKQIVLVLDVDESIKEAEKLEELYQPFKIVLNYLD